MFGIFTCKMLGRVFKTNHILQNFVSKINFSLLNHYKEQQITIAGQCINYIKIGTGNHTLFCFPGALGTIWSDFRPQLENLDKNKFTIIAWDPPGYGCSRPPNRKFTLNFYENDADTAFTLMKTLGIKKCSLLGWSDGGIACIILAAKYPDVVTKLVIWGLSAYITLVDMEAMKKVSNIRNWSEKMSTPLIATYGEDELNDLLSNWYNGVKNIYDKFDGNICKEKLSLIQCPTLILNGDKDTMVAKEHPDYLLNNIRGAKLIRFPDGKHNIHLKYATEFNKIVTKFLEENQYTSKL